MTTIKAHIRIEGGHLLSARNAHRIVARSLKPTDRNGNTLDKDGKSPIYERRNDPPYFQTWRIVKHPKKGFAFREVTHGSGMCGWRPTVRQLVITSLFGLWGTKTDMVVEVLDEKDYTAPPPLPEHRYKHSPEFKDWYDGAVWCQPKAKTGPNLEVAA